MDARGTLLGKRQYKDNILANRADFLTRWSNTLNSIYTQPAEMPSVNEFDHIDSLDMNALKTEAIDIEFGSADVAKALSKKKNKTSSGQNAVSYEMLKFAFKADPEFFTLVCKHEVNSFATVDDFKSYRIKPIFKGKGSVDDPAGYRLICILDCFRKVLETIVTDKLKQKLEDAAGKFQHAFITKRGTGTAFKQLYDHLEVFKRRRSSVHIGLLDIVKCYPSMYRVRVWKLLIHKIGNYKWYHKLHAYGTSTAHVDFGWHLLALEIDRGLFEGGVESCLYTDVVFGEIIRSVDAVHNLHLSNDINQLLGRSGYQAAVGYCDDTTLLTESKAKLTRVIHTFMSLSSFFGLKVNGPKSAYLTMDFMRRTNPNPTPTPIPIPNPITAASLDDDGEYDQDDVDPSEANVAQVHPSDSESIRLVVDEVAYLIPKVERALFLGYGLKAGSSISVKDHLDLRNRERKKDEFYRMQKRFRYVAKGDVGVVKAIFNMKYLARYFYGVNNIISLLVPQVNTLTSQNWKDWREPAWVRALNKEVIKDLAYVAPGNCNRYLAGSVFNVKPLHVKHIKDLDPLDISEYWLQFSQSNVKTWLRFHFSSVRALMKAGSLNFRGKRQFLACAYGHPSMSMYLGGYYNTECHCGHVFSTINAYTTTVGGDCHYCTLPVVEGLPPDRRNRVPAQQVYKFTSSCAEIAHCRFFNGWSGLDYGCSI